MNEADPAAAAPSGRQRHGRTSDVIHVPAGALFVLGDNRGNSCDSHMWVPDPFVPTDSVIGQAQLTFWPPTHLALTS